jgi:hypothetical protein
VTGPSTDTYRTVGVTRSTIRVKRPAASIRWAFRDAAGVSTHASPPGSYWYQIGTVSGPRSCPAETDKAAMCGSAKNSSRSRTDNLLSAMPQSLSTATDNLAGKNAERADRLVLAGEAAERRALARHVVLTT